MNDDVRNTIRCIPTTAAGIRDVITGAAPPETVDAHAAELERIAAALRAWRDTERARLTHRNAGRLVDDADTELDVAMLGEIHADLREVADLRRHTICTTAEIERLGMHASSLEHVADRLRRRERRPRETTAAPAA